MVFQEIMTKIIIGRHFVNYWFLIYYKIKIGF